MWPRLGADIVLLLHAGFVVFAVLGGLLVMRWPRAAYAHVPAALWAAGIEIAGGICPLTPLEQHLRREAGATPWSGGFIDHYLLPLLYPYGLTRPVQLALGVCVIAVNVAIYWRVFHARRVARRRENH